MVTYLHNSCEKFPKELTRTFEISVSGRGSMNFKAGFQNIKILRCPYCGKGGKQIVKEYFT